MGIAHEKAGHSPLFIHDLERSPHDQARFTGTKILLSPRWISSATDFADLATMLRTCSILRTGTPLTDSSTSPVCTPAIAAGPVTCCTSRPLSTPTSCFSSGWSGRSARPSLPLSGDAVLLASAVDLSLALARRA